MEHPDAPALLHQAGVVIGNVEHATFFLGRENLIATANRQPGMAGSANGIFSHS